MTEAETSPTRLSHRFRRMEGRDPDERGRTSTPLELLFDLTFVVAFAQAGTSAAHLIAEGHIGSAVTAFIFTMFAVCWAWINYSWLASAYDTDDWFFRLATLVIMLGVLILALGIPPFFHSIDAGEHLDNNVIVAGYVIMRVAMLALWLRAARHDPTHRAACIAYAVSIGTAQIGWIATIFVNPPLVIALGIFALLGVYETIGPFVAETRRGGTPWHAHHISERYGLLVIITLGEVITGTITAISAVVEEQGWSIEAALVAFGGTALAFALWWLYFLTPSGAVLHHHRGRSFGWGYGHIVIFASMAATGAGLHVAALYVEHEAHLAATTVVLCVAVPVLVFQIALFTLYSYLLGELDRFHAILFALSLAILAASVVAAAAGATIGVALLIIVCSPAAMVIGYETVGFRHQARALRRATA